MSRKIQGLYPLYKDIKKNMQNVPCKYFKTLVKSLKSGYNKAKPKNIKEAFFMNKSELVSKIAEKSGLTKKDSEKALDAFVESVMETLQKGDKVQLVGFGTFEIRNRAERKGRNPQTGEEITIPATKAPAFKAGAELKKAVSGQV